MGCKWWKKRHVFLLPRTWVLSPCTAFMSVFNKKTKWPPKEKWRRAQLGDVYLQRKSQPIISLSILFYLQCKLVLPSVYKSRAVVSDLCRIPSITTPVPFLVLISIQWWCLLHLSRPHGGKDDINLCARVHMRRWWAGLSLLCRWLQRGERTRLSQVAGI